MRANTKFLIVGVVALVAAFALMFFLSGGNLRDNGSKQDLFKFVKCLNEKEFVLYGFDQNQFVEMQLELFGEARGNVTHVDCSENIEDCAGIIIFPSWRTPDGIVSGGFSLEILSRLSGCKL